MAWRSWRHGAPNQVWSADIIYVPMRQGFRYLVAILDWFRRYVLAWQLSNTLDCRFCLDALEQALLLGKPEIFNTDQGVQFTAQEFAARLAGAGIRISMDGRGRALDNVFIERLWRAVKYEGIYLKEYASVPEPDAGLQASFSSTTKTVLTRAWATERRRRCIVRKRWPTTTGRLSPYVYHLIFADSWS